MESTTEETRRLHYSLDCSYKLIPQLESEIQTWAKAQNHLLRMLHQYCHVAQEARQRSGLDKAARVEAKKKLRRSEAERRSMEKQMEDLHKIIADREYLESTVADKVTELETRQEEN